MTEARNTPDRGPLWNVVIPVVTLLRAPDGPAAGNRLARALTAAGFDVYDYGDSPCVSTRPFESEDGPEESGLPGGNGQPWGR
jgi:hypothetical protein